METTTMHKSRVTMQTHLLLSTDRGLHIVDPLHVIRIQAISNYSKLYFADGRTLVVAKVLRWFELHSTLKKFIRVHRSHLVNRSFINGYTKGRGGRIHLQNGEQVNVSKRKKRFFLESWWAAA